MHGKMFNIVCCHHVTHKFEGTRYKSENKLEVTKFFYQSIIASLFCTTHDLNIQTDQAQYLKHINIMNTILSNNKYFGGIQ